MASSLDILITRIISRLTPAELIKELGLDIKQQKEGEGNLIRCFCPIHKETIVRSLAIDLQKKTFKCSYVPCQGYKGGNLLELYAYARNQSIKEVVSFWSTELGLEQEAAEITGQFSDGTESAAGTAPIASDELVYFPTDQKQLTRLVNLEMRRAERQKSAVTFIILEFIMQSVGSQSQEYWAKKTIGVEMANWLPRVLRGIDLVIQYTDDAIALVLPDTDEKGGRLLLRKIGKKMGEGKMLITIPTTYVRMSYSIATYDAKKGKPYKTSKTFINEAIQGTRLPLKPATTE